MIRKLKNLAHLALSVIANIIYCFPGKKLVVIGVTGTDGKTTTTSMIYHILKSSGKKVAMITTIGAYINDKMESTGFHVTTPSAFTIQKFLKKAVESNHEFVVIETSSHGIDQNRIWGINYRVAAITNITHEHLDYHKNFQAYANTKLKLLQRAKTAVINLDDETVSTFASKLNNKVVTYSRTNPKAELTPQSFPFTLNAFGSFNVSNALAAIGACRETGLNDDQIRSGLGTFNSPAGRQEIVYNDKFKIMVDFAHTPNAIETLLNEVKATNPNRIIHLFGAPGRRDESKRPLMGRASAKFADIMIITADDPRNEKVTDIISQIRHGVSSKFETDKNLFEIEDRREAIRLALKMAQPGDFVVLTGKGHEPTLALANQELPWNEKEIVLNLINSR